MRSILRRMVGGTACGGAVLSLFVVALTGLIVGAPLTARAQDATQDVTITFANRTASSIELVSDPALLSFESLEKLPNGTSAWEACSFQTTGGGNANIAENLQYFTPACNVSNQGLWRATFTATRDFTFTSATFTIFLFSNGGGGMEGARNVKYSLTVGDVTAEKQQECAASPATTNLTITFETAVSVKAGDTLTLNGLTSSGNYTTNSGFTQIVLGGVSLAEPELSPNVVWTVRPTLTGRTLNQAAAGSFSVLLNGLQRVGAAPSRVPETVPLQSVTVGLSNGCGGGHVGVGACQRDLSLHGGGGAVWGAHEGRLRFGHRGSDGGRRCAGRDGEHRRAPVPLGGCRGGDAALSDRRQRHVLLWMGAEHGLRAGQGHIAHADGDGGAAVARTQQREHELGKLEHAPSAPEWLGADVRGGAADAVAQRGLPPRDHVQVGE